MLAYRVFFWGTGNKKSLMDPKPPKKRSSPSLPKQTNSEVAPENGWLKYTIFLLPRGSMYGIFPYIWLIFMVHVGKYTIHGSYGFWDGLYFRGKLLVSGNFGLFDVDLVWCPEIWKKQDAARIHQVSQGKIQDESRSTLLKTCGSWIWHSLDGFWPKMMCTHVHYLQSGAWLLCIGWQYLTW